MNSYEPVIGLEVHVELNTKSKMFCKCSADYFGKEPNTHTCPVCLGLPGALPFINKEAIDKCMMIGLALNCSISEKSLFERKNYFYPDLAKGFQISQLRWPLSVNGRMTLDNKQSLRSNDLGKVIRINRAHQEEDTGKLTHIGGESLIDFNRCGVPLVEIVTEPDFDETSQVKEYAKKLQQIFRNLGVSNADMEKGDMRLEANVSVRLQGDKNLPNYRVELKNINSFRFMDAAIKYEIERQIKALEAGEKLTQETRGWDEIKKSTYLQRSKEEAHDYRYFPEPDLPHLTIKNEELRIKELIKGKLPQEKVEQLTTTYDISRQLAKLLVNLGKASLFEQVMKIGQSEGLNSQETANYIINRKLDQLVTPQEIISDIQSQSAGIISDTDELERICQEVVYENPQIVEDYRGGKETVIQALIGQIMRKTQGKADAGIVNELLEELLKP